MACSSGRIHSTLSMFSFRHRRVGLTAFVLMMSMGADVSVHAIEGENYTLKNPKPTSIEEVTKEIDEITKRLTEVQCGGWNRDVSVGANLGEYISKVAGVPGREGEPLGDIASGMAKRKDEFTYPSGARGLVTACKNGLSKQDIQFYRNGDEPGTRNDSAKDRPYPFFADRHVCLWRGEDNILEEPLSRGICNNACDIYMNAPIYTFKDCKPEDVKKNASGQWECTKWSDRAICSDDWVDSGNTNCKICAGARCRCPGPGCELSKAMTQYKSFFRAYQVQSVRRQLPEAPKDVMDTFRASVHCYGYYQELDGKTTTTYPRHHQRCVIGEIKADDLTGIFESRLLLREKQKGKGKYTIENLPDSLPGTRTYDPKKDIWFTKVMGAFSFLNPKVDLTTGLLNPEQGKIEATVQNTKEQPYMAESTLRAVDDTVTSGTNGFRPFTAWWQKFLSDGQRIFTPPIVRLRLPATWNQSIAALNPVAVTPIVTRDRRTEAIEVQLHAKEDLAGIVAEQLKRSLMLDVREEPVPMVIPMGSPVELRAVAQQWEEWRDRRTQARAAVPGQVHTLIQQLYAYAENIEEVRTIRAQLPMLFATLLEKQASFLVGVNTWAEQNRAAFQQYIALASEREKLMPLWAKVVSKQTEFANKTNFPWCKNDRFTTPIYTLNDPWLPGRPDLFGGIPTCAASPQEPESVGTINPFPAERQGALPILCIPSGEKELVYDLSLLRVTTGAIILPVIKPVQVRLQLPVPGPLDQDIVNPDSLVLPDLPQVPDITENFAKSIPASESLSVPRSLPPPVAANAADLKAALERAEKLLTERNKEYERFWKSIDFLQGDEATPFEERIPTCPTKNGEKKIGQLDCCTWGDVRCAHTEFDLLERITRITARPAVMLKEDLLSVGYAQTRIPKAEDKTQLRPEVYATCWPTDHTCQPLLPKQEVPPDGWQVVFPKQKQDLSLEEIRAKVRAYTLTPSGKIVGSPPLPLAAKAQELYPTYSVPESYDLRAPKK